MGAQSNLCRREELRASRFGITENYNASLAESARLPYVESHGTCPTEIALEPEAEAEPEAMAEPLDRRRAAAEGEPEAAVKVEAMMAEAEGAL